MENSKNKQPILFGPDGKEVLSSSKYSKRKNKPSNIWKKYLKVWSAVIGVIGIAFAIYAYYYPLGEPDLYISFHKKGEYLDLKPSDGYILSPQKVRYFNIDYNDPKDAYMFGFMNLTLDGLASIYQHISFVNMGNRKADEIHAKIFIDDRILKAYIVGAGVNYGYEETGREFFKIESRISVSKKSFEPSATGIVLRMPFVSRKYELPDIIWAKGVKPKEGVLRFIVDVKNIPDAYIDNDNGLELMKKGNIKEALKSFKIAVKKISNNAAFQFNLGNAYLQMNRLKEAEKHLLTAAKYASDLDMDKAIGADYSPKCIIWGALADCFCRQSRWNNALIYLEKGIKKCSDNNKYRFNLGIGTIYLQMKKPAKAEKYLLIASKISPWNYKVWGNLGACYMMQFRLKEALEAINKALEINPLSKEDLQNQYTIVENLKSIKNK